MRRTGLRRSRQGGVLLDVIIGASLLLFGAFALASLGLTLGEIVHGAIRFFGLG